MLASMSGFHDSDFVEIGCGLGVGRRVNVPSHTLLVPPPAGCHQGLCVLPWPREWGGGGGEHHYVKGHEPMTVEVSQGFQVALLSLTHQSISSSTQFESQRPRVILWTHGCVQPVTADVRKPTVPHSHVLPCRDCCTSGVLNH